MAIKDFVKETVVGLLYGIFVWGTKSSSPPYISRRSCRRPSSLHGGGGVDDEKGQQYQGLEIALDHPPPSEVENPSNDDEKKTRLLLKSCMAPPRPSPSPSPPSFFTLMPSELSSLWTKSTTGDLLGTESGVHMVSAAVMAPPWGNPNPSLDETTTGCRRVKLKQETKRWDIPPPLTWLQRRRREYNAGGHYPNSLNREYINGRLILKEMAVEVDNVQDTGGEDTRRGLHIDLVLAEDDDQENSFPVTDDDENRLIPFCQDMKNGD